MKRYKVKISPSKKFYTVWDIDKTGHKQGAYILTAKEFKEFCKERKIKFKEAL